MRIKSLVSVALLLVAVLAQSAFAADWNVDKAHSYVYFDVKHILSTVRGSFTEFDAKISLDPDKPEQGKIMMTIKTASINTGITKRDNHLRSADFFDANTYPEMTFVSTGIKRSDETMLLVSGDLTIKGKTHAVTIPMEITGVVDNPLKEDQKVAGFDSRFTIDRLSYGVGTGKFYDLGVVGKEVEVFITIEALSD